MKITQQLANDHCFQANCGHLFSLIAKGIDAVNGMLWQSGQGGDPSPQEEQQMEDCELEAELIAKEIYLALTGCKVIKLEEIPFSGKKIPNYQLSNFISPMETSHQNDVGRLLFLLIDAISIIENEGMLVDNSLEGGENKIKMMHIAKEIFIGLTGKYVLRSIPV